MIVTKLGEETEVRQEVHGTFLPCELEALAMFSFEPGIGLGVADNLFFGRVPFQLSIHSD